MDHLTDYIEQLGKPETLEQAIAERDAWVETAMMFSRNEAIGKMLGRDAYTADDGSFSQDVLCAKVPEIVAARLVH
jgi:hypothetical protein